MTKNSLFRFCAVLGLSFMMTGFICAQTDSKTTTTTTVTKQEVVQNPDGSYSVIEYPVGKEVTIELTPMNMQGAKGWAKVMRSNDGTNVALDLTGLPADTKSYYVYAVDPNGGATFLGPTMIEGGAGKATFTTPMNQFMLVLSPTEGLTSIGNDTAISFRSAVPTGYAVVPMGNRWNGKEAKEKQVASTDTVASTYNVPLLNVPSFDNKTTEIRIAFEGELQGLKGKAYIDPRKDGATQVKMRFDDMKMAPKDKRFILWASSPDGKYTKLGQVVNTGARQESEIRSETAMKDFGLFVTMEDTDVAQPTGRVYSTFRMP
ncbi:MAG TPA: hypothetical protein VGC76_02270 [Pyrinomonadaceae bacterium]